MEYIEIFRKPNYQNAKFLQKDNRKAKSQYAADLRASPSICQNMNVLFFLHAHVHACSIMSDSLPPKDNSPPGSSVYGIFQARILEWVSISYFSGSSQPRYRIHVSFVFCILQMDSLPLSHSRSPFIYRHFIKI